METMEKIKVEKYSKYKPSGVDWLGEIPENWELQPSKRLHVVKKHLNSNKQSDNILSLTLRGVVNNDPDSPEGLVPKDYRSYQLFEKNNLVFKLIDLENVKTSRVGIVHENGIMSSAYIRLIIGNHTIPRYAFYYYFNLYLNEVYNNLGSGVRSTLGPNDLLNLPFICPSKEEQTAIATFLDHKTSLIDKAIGIKEKQIELLKERRQIFIHKAVSRGLNPNVKMKESSEEWIGKVPEHWEVCNNFVLFQERKEPGNESLPLLSVSIHTAVSSEELDDDENIRGKIKIQDKSCYKFVDMNDIVFNMMRAWQGAIGAVRVKGMVSPAYIVAKSKFEINADYFEYQYRTTNFIQQMDRNSKGITDFRKRLYWDEFKQLLSIVPPLSEQNQIAEFIESVNTKTTTAINLKNFEIEKLKEYKATLISSAVTGKIKLTK